MASLKTSTLRASLICALVAVLGVSGISNVAIDQIDTDAEASHEEVLQAGELLTPRMTTLIKGLLARM